MMLYSLNHNKVKKFKYSVVDNKKVVCIENKVWFEYQHGFSAQKDIKQCWKENIQISDYGDIRGTNSYARMWDEKNVFNTLTSE